MAEAAQLQRRLAGEHGPEAVQRVELLRLRFEEGLPPRWVAAGGCILLTTGAGLHYAAQVESEKTRDATFWRASVRNASARIAIPPICCGHIDRTNQGGAHRANMPEFSIAKRLCQHAGDDLPHLAGA